MTRGIAPPLRVPSSDPVNLPTRLLAHLVLRSSTSERRAIRLEQLSL